MEKDRCPKCKSVNIYMERNYFFDDDGNKVFVDSWDAHCNDCGWDFILIDI